MTRITKRLSGYPFIEYLRQEDFNMQLLEECKLNYIANATKIFVNGAWVGVTNTPKETDQLVLHRRNGLFNIFISVHWNIHRDEILIQTDASFSSILPVTGDELSFERD